MSWRNARSHRSRKPRSSSWTARRTFLRRLDKTVGTAQGTAFMATDRYIRDNRDVVQSWTNVIYRAQRWTATAPLADITTVLEPYSRARNTARKGMGLGSYRVGAGDRGRHRARVVAFTPQFPMDTTIAWRR